MEAVRVRALAHAPAGDPFDLDIDLLPNLGSGSADCCSRDGNVVNPSCDAYQGWLRVLGLAPSARWTQQAQISMTPGAYVLGSPQTWCWLAGVAPLGRPRTRTSCGVHRSARSRQRVAPWTTTSYTGSVQWNGGVPMPPGCLRIAGSGPKASVIYSNDYRELGRVLYPFSQTAVGLTVASVETVRPTLV